MTTTVYIHVTGNKAVKITRAGDGQNPETASSTMKPGAGPVQFLIHGEQSLTIEETGDFIENTIDAKAKRAWDAYCAQAGGVTFDGNPLPTWIELGADRQECWRAAVQAV